MRLILAFFLLFPGVLAAQANKWLISNGSSIFSEGNIHDISSDSAIQQESLTLLADKLDLHTSSLDMYEFKASPFGHHLSYRQLYAGTEIYGAHIKLNLASNGNVLSIFYKLLPQITLPETIHNAAIDEKQIVELTNGNYLFYAKKVWFYNEQELLPAFAVEFQNQELKKHEEFVCDTSYNVLYRRSKTLNLGPDSLVQAYVYMPDPITTAQSEYKAPFLDNDDKDGAEINQQRVLVSIRTEYENDSFYLSGPYAKVINHTFPNTPVTYSKNGIFDFNRSQTGFEDVNAYYHVSTYQEYVQDLGFDSLGNFPVNIDAHATYEDQSAFDFIPDLRLSFGLGGIDDAEDADVIIHEYAHFLSYCASGDVVAGKERQILEEGMCDYLACSYSRALSEYNWEKLFNWDGNETWKGRSCVSNKRYPQDLSGSIYSDVDIWAGAFMEVSEIAGRERTDRSMLGSFYTFGKNISLMDAAKSFMQVDSLLHEDGSNRWKYAVALNNRGLLPESYVVVNEPQEDIEAALKYYGFNTAYSLILEFNTNLQGTVSLLDIQGKDIISRNFNGSKVTLGLERPVAQGVYLLRIATPQLNQTVKLIKSN